MTSFLDSQSPELIAKPSMTLMFASDEPCSHVSLRPKNPDGLLNVSTSDVTDVIFSTSADADVGLFTSADADADADVWYLVNQSNS